MIRLTRGNVIGQHYRIAKVYGCSVLGLKVRIAYDRAVGDRNVFSEHILRMAQQRGARGFQPCNGVRVRDRQLTPQLRAIREVAARADREAA